MRYLVLVLSLIALNAFVQPVAARNVPYTLKIQDVLDSAEFRDKVGSSVAFAFGNRKVAVSATLDEIVANARDHFKGRSDEGACRGTLILALQELKRRAQNSDGDAVIDIVSYFRRQTFSSPTEFECHAGSSGVFVSLKGTVAKLQR